MSTLTKQQLDAAHAMANATMAAFQANQRVHPATLVAASARMAGTYLFRSFHLKLAGVLPGQVVLSRAATEKSQLLVQLTAGILHRLSIKIPESPPAASNDPKTKPLLEFLDTQRKLEPALASIIAGFRLSGEQAAQAAAAATALLIRHCAQALDPTVAFGIAVYSFIEGSKTAPEPVELPHTAV